MKRLLQNKLLQWKQDKERKPLLLKGARQVGKTYLLKEFGLISFKKCHYFNFEKSPELATLFEKNLDPKRILNELSFFAKKSINVGDDLVIFDEIQEVPKALTSLKYFCEELPALHLCAAGSLLGLHLNSSSFPVGKVIFETLRPMSFTEFLMALQDESLPFLNQLKEKQEIPEIVHAHLKEQLKTYFITGGLPEVVSTFIALQEKPFDAFNVVRKKQQDILNAYYADIAKHSGKVNAMHIDRVFKAIPNQMNQIKDTSLSRFKFKGVVPGVSHYNRLASAIDWLEATGLVLKVHIVNAAHVPLRSYTKENFFKLLLFDVGMLGCMSELSPSAIIEANYGSFKGYFAENFVAQEFVSKDRESLYSWQEGTSEIEFLLEQDQKIIPVEVKSGNNTSAKSLKVFAQKYHPPTEMIFSSNPLNIKGKVQHYPLYSAGVI